MKYRPTYLSFSSIDKVIPHGDNRKIILSAITMATSVLVGLGATYNEEAAPIGDGVEDDFTASLINFPILEGTVIVYVDGVQVAIDNGAGVIVGNPTPGDVTSGTINYATGTFAIKFSAPAVPALDSVVSIGYTALDNALADSRLSITGTAPLDLSAFLRNAPYSFFESGRDTIIRLGAALLTTIAFAEVKG